MQGIFENQDYFTQVATLSTLYGASMGVLEAGLSAGVERFERIDNFVKGQLQRPYARVLRDGVIAVGLGLAVMQADPLPTENYNLLQEAGTVAAGYGLLRTFKYMTRNLTPPVIKTAAGFPRAFINQFKAKDTAPSSQNSIDSKLEMEEPERHSPL